MITGPLYISQNTDASLLWYVSVCLSVTYLTHLLFTLNWNVIKSVYFHGRYLYASAKHHIFLPN